MVRLSKTAFAVVAAVGFAFSSPAAAAVTLVQQHGPDLTTAIHASDDGSPNTGTTVYGTTVLHMNPSDVAFTGYSSYNPLTATGTTTSITVTGGSGFAQISDTDYTNPTGNNPNPATNNLFAILMNPVPNFYLYEFSLLTQNGGQAVNVYYMLTGQTTWTLASGSGLLNGNGDTQYIVGDASNPNLSIDQILVASVSPIYQLKQNSIQLTGTSPAPEPATWAMMLLGFGGIGMALRRSKRRSSQKLLQIA